MMRLFMVALSEAADPVKRKAFEAEINGLEQQVTQEGFIPAVSVQAADGFLIGAVSVQKVDLSSRMMVPVTEEEWARRTQGAPSRRGGTSLLQ